MQIKQFRLSYIVVIILIGVLVFGLGFTSYSRSVPVHVYQVYIDGEKIGIVKDDKDFDLYINKKQEDIKKKYKVDKVYMPNGVNIKSVTMYNPKIDTNEEIYQTVVKMKQFTIKGTVITINDKEQEGYETKYIYTINEDVFDKAIDELIRSFVEEEEYNSYLESSVPILIIVAPFFIASL